jgi:hypothetical protein
MVADKSQGLPLHATIIGTASRMYTTSRCEFEDLVVRPQYSAVCRLQGCKIKGTSREKPPRHENRISQIEEDQMRGKSERRQDTASLVAV